MKYMLLLLSACWCASAIHPEMYSLLDAGRHFVQFTQRFNKHYHSDEERAARFQIFKDNLLQANRLNRESDTAVFGISPFLDLTTEEFSRQFAGIPVNKTLSTAPCQALTDAQIPNVNAPESLDYRNSRYVTAVKNQGLCGSCYAFSSTGNIEGQCAKHFRKLPTLSEQQIVDCSSRNFGCKSGWMSEAFWALIHLGGSVSERQYPYVGQQTQCRRPQPAVARLSGCRIYNLKSQDKLKQLLYQNGPVSLILEPTNFQFYRSGILSDKDCYQPNPGLLHAVLLVGYGTDTNGNKYWLLKNSWGVNWGEQGYFRIHRDEGAFSCGMMKYERSSAVVASCG
ncbi:cathepsin L-like [Anticarsia gemmatalis]|uniref:cathepsin L-like n=1 Tax=Anticarsia gemmatalis TaxID=129554 RepID=UPI003F761FEE